MNVKGYIEGVTVHTGGVIHQLPRMAHGVCHKDQSSDDDNR